MSEWHSYAKLRLSPENDVGSLNQGDTQVNKKLRSLNRERNATALPLTSQIVTIPDSNMKSGNQFYCQAKSFNNRRLNKIIGGAVVD